MTPQGVSKMDTPLLRARNGILTKNTHTFVCTQNKAGCISYAPFTYAVKFDIIDLEYIE